MFEKKKILYIVNIKVFKLIMREKKIYILTKLAFANTIFFHGGC